MGQAVSCFQGSPAEQVDLLLVTSKTTTKGFSPSNGVTSVDASCAVKQHAEAPGPAQSAAPQGGLDPSLAACCLGAAAQPGGVYDVSSSGPPLPGCEADRLEQSHLGELLEFAPKDELRTILALVCNMFRVKNALVSLFFDRRVYIIDGTGVFSEGDFPWRYSMCGWTMASERHCVMIVNDVSQDARFCNSPAAKQYGVRFYVGAPLVSSSGHRLGTLCFADSEPRVFDDASLKLLCNFSELVTRALERDLVLAHHQQMMKPGEALRELQEKHRYSMALRSIDSISSPVLLIDTGTTGWVVRYANSGWQRLVEQVLATQATQDWVNAAAAGAPPGQPHSAAASGASNAVLPDAAAAAGAGAGASGSSNSFVQQQSGALQGAANPDTFSRIAGQLLFPIIEKQLAKEPDGGAGIIQQLQQLLPTLQPFSLHGVELEAFGGAAATLVFRSAGLSDLDGAVSICVPTWVPQPGSLTTAAAALQARAADGMAPSTACPPWQTLYFVTVLLEGPQDRHLQVKLPGTQASTCGTFSVSSGRRNSSSKSAGNGSSSSGSRMSLTLPSAGQVQEGVARCVYDDSNLLLLSRMGSLDRSACTTNAVSTTSSSNADSGSLTAASLVGSCFTSITSVAGAAAARAVCSRIEGLRMGGLIASGSYGRIYRGDYYGSTVAVKVLESDSVIRREAMTGLCLEALLGEKFRHPNIISTLAWAVVTGKSKLSVGKRLWGESLDVDRPSIPQNKAAIAAAAAAASAATDQHPQLDQQQQQLAVASGGHAGGCGGSSSTRAPSVDMPSVSQQLPSVDAVSEDSIASSLLTAETWLVLEYCNKGCLQDAIDRGWLREGTEGPVSLTKVIVTATEIAAGMFTLHKADVVHGDLSPFNVLLSGADPAASTGRGFIAKISDFGLSRPMGGQSKMLTKTYGTITHMGPELLEHGVTSKAVDVYSFGVLLWQMLASSRAWAGLSHHGVVHAVCVKKKRLHFPADAPEALVDLGQACMSFRPEDRPTFRDVLDVLTPLRDFICQALTDQRQ